jgi:hypothetical protein
VSDVASDFDRDLVIDAEGIAYVGYDSEVCLSVRGDFSQETIVLPRGAAFQVTREAKCHRVRGAKTLGGRYLDAQPDDVQKSCYLAAIARLLDP